MAINIVLTMAEAGASGSAHMQLTMKFNSDLIWFKCAALLRFVGTMDAKLIGFLCLRNGFCHRHGANIASCYM